jgi:beta-glucosidase
MNIHRNPLVVETLKLPEDPLVSGKIAAAMVNGIHLMAGTSIKHLLLTIKSANGCTRKRKSFTRNILESFEIAVKEAQPWTVMSSYNYLNGTHTSARKDLLTTPETSGGKGLL